MSFIKVKLALVNVVRFTKCWTVFFKIIVINRGFYSNWVMVVYLKIIVMTYLMVTDMIFEIALKIMKNYD